MLTLFSEPSLNSGYNFYKFAKKTKWRWQGKKFPEYAGHPTVDRSICTGLEQLGIEFNYNPKNIAEVAKHVHVLAGVDALKMAIQLKREKKIQRLTAGVNIVVSSADHNGIVGSPEIDLYTANSPWIKDFYLQENSALNDEMGIWYAGIETEYWNIPKSTDRGSAPKFLLYLKRPEYKLVQECEDILNKNSLAYQTIEYGKYNLEELKQKLSETDFVIYFVEQESQGIALFEIWATDTPTFVWNPGYWQYQSKNFRSSSAPYLTDRTGHFFRDKIEFERLISGELDLSKYKPKEWIMENGSDKKAAEVFLKAIKYEH